MVNATDSASSSISWSITPPDEVDFYQLRYFITGVLTNTGRDLGFHAEIGPEGLDFLACKDTGYKIVISNTIGLNTIHKTKLSGAGEIKLADGHKGLLVLLALQERFKSFYTYAKDPLVQFCDEQGNTIELLNKSLSTIEGDVKKLGFDFDAFSEDAVRVGGIAVEQVNLSKIKTEVEDFFF